MDALTLPTRSGDAADVTVLVVNYNTAHLLEQMFSALYSAQGKLKLQVIVVDNASRDRSIDTVRQAYPSVELIANSTNVGFGRANNQALPQIRGRYVLLLNTDAIVSVETLQKTVEFMNANPRCGVLGVKLVGPDGTLQPSCRYFPTPWNIFLASTGLKRYFPRASLVDDLSWDHATVRECDWVPGCYYLTRREVIEQVGLFDPRYFLYYEEVDHCQRVRAAGWHVIYYPFTEVVHIGGESAATEGTLNARSRQISTFQIESQLLYFRKHYGIVGLVANVLLAPLADALMGCKALVRRGEIKLFMLHVRHTWLMLKLLISTRLASRATR